MFIAKTKFVFAQSWRTFLSPGIQVIQRGYVSSIADQSTMRKLLKDEEKYEEMNEEEPECVGT